MASQVAKGGNGMVGLAGQWLNVVLEELCTIRDLKINRVTETITATAGTYGPFALEADYLRTYDIFYQIPQAGGVTQSSQTLFLAPWTMEQLDAAFKSPTQTNYPYAYATDLSTQAQVWSGGQQGRGTLTSAGGLYIYPGSSGVLPLTHRYMKRQDPISLPQTSTKEPWFPYTNYLVTATAAYMLRSTGDDRWTAMWQQAEEMLRPFLIQEGDEQQAVVSVRLDPRRFQFNLGLRPTKASPL